MYLFTTINANVTFQPKIKMKWGGWRDDLSGIDHFQIEVFELVHKGNHLDHIIGKATYLNDKISASTSEVCMFHYFSYTHVL